MTCLSCVDGSDHSFMLSVQCTLDSHSLDRYRYDSISIQWLQYHLEIGGRDCLQPRVLCRQIQVTCISACTPSLAVKVVC